ncbi:MAG: efflux RND transporter permease subunit [Bacillota bacterium]|nr:efflux RND transporter permease subunit [Bacillota bacterium]
MNPAKLAIQYKQLTFVILLLIVTAGIFSFINMPRQEDPDMNPPYAQILTLYPGANSTQVEQLVTNVIEQELAEIVEIKRTTSNSWRSYSSIIIELGYEMDQDKVWKKVEEKLNQAREKLPAEAHEPQFNTELVNTVTSVISISGLDPIHTNEVVALLDQELLLIPAIAKTKVLGQYEEELLITVDDQKLAHYGLTLAQLVNAVKGSNLNIPGASLELGSHQLSLNTPNLLSDLADLEQIVIGLSAEGWPLYLKDVAQIELVKQKEDYKIRTNGLPAQIIEVTMKEGENVVKLGHEMKQVIAAVSKTASPDINIELIADQPTDVQFRLNNFAQTLLLGMALVIVTVLLAMGWQNALIVCIAIPLSVTVAFAGMGLWEVSLHQVSIAALVIALGILVDNAIVVNDNIYRHWQNGATPFAACTEGLKEVAIPVLSSTLTTIAAFIPLMMMPDDVGQFIKAIPQVVSLSLSASLLIAITITPLVFFLIIGRKSKSNPVENQASSDTNESTSGGLYQHLLLKAINSPKLVVSMALLFLLGTGILIPRLGVEFFPPSDKNIVLIQVATPSGTDLLETDRLTQEVEEFLAQEPLALNYSSFIGRGVPKFYYNIFPADKSPTHAQIMVTLAADKGRINKDGQLISVGELASHWQNQLQNMIGAGRIRIDLLEQGPPVGAPVAFRFLGPQLDVLADLAEKALTEIRTIPGTTAEYHSLQEQELSVEILVDNDKAAMVGLSPLEIAMALRYVDHRQEVTALKLGTQEIPVMLSVASEATNAHNLESLQITSAITGKSVPLSQLAQFKPTWHWTDIAHWNNQPVVFVYSYVESGYNTDKIMIEASPLLESIQLPPGYRLEVGGQTEDQIMSFMNLAQAGIAAVLLIYLILIFQFNSLTQPLLIVMAIPLTVIGSVVGLYLLGYPIGFMAFLGVVSLIGIVVNNAIVLVDFINCRRREGLELQEAIVNAGVQRLRPILLTTATTIGGLLPLSLTGGNLWGPMGFAIIFGLAGSTLLTLIVMPTLYYLFEKNKTLKVKDTDRALGM